MKLYFLAILTGTAAAQQHVSSVPTKMAIGAKHPPPPTRNDSFSMDRRVLDKETDANYNSFPARDDSFSMARHALDKERVLRRHHESLPIIDIVDSLGFDGTFGAGLCNCC